MRGRAPKSLDKEKSTPENAGNSVGEEYFSVEDVFFELQFVERREVHSRVN